MNRPLWWPVIELIAPIVMLTWIVSPGAAQDGGLNSGQIAGSVVNGSQGNRPVVGASVLLRAGDEHGLVPLAQTVTDEKGEFRFEGLPIDEQLVFLPGANHEDIHYPGPRVRLSLNLQRQLVKVTVFDLAAEPCPLEAKSHHMVVRADTGLLKVSETLVVSNPSTYSFVGKADTSDAPPATLRLHIPSDFLKVTFDEEFFGRQFHIADGALQTEIPWTPGERTISLTYFLPFEKGRLELRRALDLPCRDVRVTVHGLDGDQIHCSLAPDQLATDGTHIYSSSAGSLPAGHVVTIELGGLPVPVINYARWGAAVLLVAMVGLTVVAQQRGWRIRGRLGRWQRLSVSH